MLTKEELQKIIDQFDEDKLNQQAIFGIFQYGGGPDESFIKANKEGLEFFALKLLKSARDTATTLADTQKNIIPFNDEENWIDENSDTIIQFVEPVAGKQKLQPKTKTSVAGKLLPYGCALLIIILAVAVLAGLATIFKWLF